MAGSANRLPMCSLGCASAPVLVFLFPSPAFQMFGNAGTQAVLMLCIAFGLGGVVIGVTAIIQRGASSLVPAYLGIVIGGLAAFVSSALLFLVLTPNAPF